MKTVYSRDNKIYRLARELSQKKHRDRKELYIIEGDNLINEALKSGIKPEMTIIREDYDGPSRGALEDMPGTVKMSRQLFDKAAQTETSQGIMAFVRKNVFTPDSFFSETGKGNIVLLDRLQDPGNIGTVIRTAEAAGYRGIISLKGTGDIYSPKAVRASAGSVFRMPVLFAEDLSQVAGRIKESGRRLISTCMDGETPYYEADMKNDIVLVIGNEGNGVCREITENADVRVRIPMAGLIESLNASIAAAILMYENIRN